MPENKGRVWKTQQIWNKAESKLGKEQVDSKLPEGMGLILWFMYDIKWTLILNGY